MLLALEELEKSLARLPGLGRRSAERAALALVRKPELSEALEAALRSARGALCCCELCGGFTTRDANPCRMCRDDRRDGGVICVVEEPADIVSFERAGAFNGRYHALGGRLSPAKGVAPADLRIEQLLKRIKTEQIREVILAMSTDIEGDSTAAFLREALSETPVRVTRLAFGLPVGSSIGYADPITLKRALKGRL